MTTAARSSGPEARLPPCTAPPAGSSPAWANSLSDRPESSPTTATGERPESLVRTTDVAIIGGGPAGATAACLLARQGYTVTVFEQARFPRFHIGESLLPANIPMFETLGIKERVAAVSMQKNGIELVSPHHDHTAMLTFEQSWDKTMPYSFQVRRADFDQIVLERAAELGATVHENTRVSHVNLQGPDGGVTLTTTGNAPDDTSAGAGCWHARFVIDASGRDTFLAGKLKAKRKNPKHNSAALYGHFEGATRLPGDAEGNITIFWFEHGWFWFIPLTNGTTSIGAVCWPYYLKARSGDLESFLHETIALCPRLQERLVNAQLVSPVEATGNYSYSADHCHGGNYLLLGDAFAFIDPVFSSGVFLAMNSAFAGAEAVDTCLREPHRSRQALARFEKTMHRGPREFSWFIYRITQPGMRDLFMAPRNVLRMREALMSVLAGDIFGKTPIWPSVWAFRALYYANCVVRLPRTVAAWRRRRNNIRDVAAV